MYKIGEFAKLSRIPVKTLRYYADIGLLPPKEVDPFTGYRFYSGGQLEAARQILALKELGFSLEEIRAYKEDASALLRRREQEILCEINQLTRQLAVIRSSQNRMDKEDAVVFHVCMGKMEDSVPAIPGIGKGERLKLARLVCREEQKEDAYVYLVNELCGSGGWKEGEWQLAGRVSEKHVEPDIVELTVPVWHLEECRETPQNESLDLPFEDDPGVVGYWKVVSGDCYCPEDFNPETSEWEPVEGDLKELYFLPGGEKYWFVSWTKGYVKARYSAPVCEGLFPYELREIDGRMYMFLWFKGRDFFYRGGLPHLLVLTKVDGRARTKAEIRVYDDLPSGFQEDSAVHGKWKSIDFVRNPDLYEPGRYNADFPKDLLYFRRISFLPEGECCLQYGGETWKSPDVTWTAETVCDKKRGLAQQYERRILDGMEVLFVQFKSGDYFYNHLEPWWYVFVREAE